VTAAPIVAVDVETDGLHPGRRVWEVAMIRRDERGERERQFFVAIDLRNSDPKGLQIGGYWDRHPHGKAISTPPGYPVTDSAPMTPELVAAAREAACPPPVLSKFDAARVVAKWTFGAHLVGVNPAFDAETLAGLLRSEGHIEGWHYHLIDMVAMSIGWLQGIKAHLHPEDCGPPWKSDVLSRYCGVEPPGNDRHTALADAKWALAWYDRIAGSAA
jgi:hypothetical protein